MKSEALVKGVIGICNPFDLLHLEQYAKKFAFGMFHKVFGDHMKHVMEEHLTALRPLEKEIGPLEKVLGKINSLTDYDNYITSKTHGYSTAQDCYRKTSSVLVLNEITTPTLFVNSLDDPVVK